jgi:NAD(P)H dehydrogenase (quinone)
MFLVSGITGRVGRATARELLKRGHAVRGLVRDAKKATEWWERGVDLVQGDFTNSGSVAGALREINGAFLMLPTVSSPTPGFPEAKALITSLRNALWQVSPHLLVVLSSVGSQQTSGLGLITQTHLLEQELADLPFPTAFIRAGSFLENYTAALEPTAAKGIYFRFLRPTDRAVPMAATADIGREVARLLVTGWMGKKIVELGS